MSDDVVAYGLAHLREAGSETTASTLDAFIQAMILYPEVQLEARTELDRICPDRLPTMEDRAQLPYVCATIKEALRWFPVLTLGVPHCATEDDEYMGYYIPKGATVMMNIFTLNRNPERYPNPRVFDPARFLGDHTTAAESATSIDVSQRDHFSFGAGRRICPGLHIAERTLFLSIARLLWGFDISKGRKPVKSGDRGTQWVEITPDQDDIVGAIASRPVPFPATIRPRSERHTQVMRKAWKDCHSLLDEHGQWKDAPQYAFEES